MVPATVSASFAFMLPVATPPNTMAFSYQYLRVTDMVSILCTSKEWIPTEPSSHFQFAT